MRFARRAGFDHQAGAGAQALGHQMLMHRRGGQQRRDGDVLGVELAVGDDQDVGSRAAPRPRLRRTERRQARFDAFLAPGQRIADVEFGRVELVVGVGAMLRSLAMSAKVSTGWALPGGTAG
jgi:hypothetical protein